MWNRQLESEKRNLNGKMESWTESSTKGSFEVNVFEVKPVGRTLCPTPSPFFCKNRVQGLLY